MVRWIRTHPDRDTGIDTTSWPGSVPAVEQILAEGLELPAGLTVVVGENGSGKSTVVELLAEACGLNPQGGSAHGRYRQRGFYLMDEPDAPLSFTSCLALVAPVPRRARLLLPPPARRLTPQGPGSRPGRRIRQTCTEDMGLRRNERLLSWSTRTWAVPACQ